ncbi:MAG: tRNA lysidine(34) synthetase TilS [Dehalococcoidia bacterium]|nr:MAG: tRNA lysidine(34) synthetase TilS [Dehalococcoidia bacterium]
MEDLRRRILKSIQREALIEGEETLLVGVSGGPDSVCLLHILCQLKETLGVVLHVVHLNHMLRGAASHADARYVSQLAQRLGLAATVEERDVLAYQKEHRLSLEEAARVVRYDFFAEVATSLGARRIALGHTADDQVETILMHLVRGSGLAGLRGMQAITLWRSCQSGASVLVVRPLLEVTREETEEYCRAYDLEPRTDFSNYALDHTRNRFRYELVPLLQSYNPNIGAALMRTARAAADDLSFLEEQLSLVWDRVVREQPNGLLLDTKAVDSLHPALRRHLLRRVLQGLLGDLADIESIHIEKMMEALSKPAGKRLFLPKGLVFYIGYNTCVVTKGAFDTCPFPPLEGENRINLPGETILPGWRVKATITPHLPQDARGGGFSTYLDLDEAGTNLLVRGRRAGDRFQPLGMEQPKKLQDFMVDAKIPRAWRDRVPLVCSPEGILWVVGWRIAEQVRVRDNTKQVLLLEFERI